jgi:YidC/Oxa1 family membrane protein insertase
MIAMQKVAPQIKKIQAEFKDDKQRQNEEVLKFYQENKINPLSGCFPLLAQMPVLISLFQVLRDPQKHVPKPGHAFDRLYNDLCGGSGKCVPSAHFLGIDLFEKLSDNYLNIPLLLLIALVVLASWYQSYQTIQRQRNTGGADSITSQMKIMTNIAPVMIGVFSISVPAGLPLYWLTSSAWRIGQQHFVLNKFYDDPEYKQIVREAASERSKNPKAKPGAKGAGPAKKAKPAAAKPVSGRVTQPGKRPQPKKKR